MIYFYHDRTMPIYLLLVYAKARQGNWSSQERASARTLVAGIVAEHRRRRGDR